MHGFSALLLLVLTLFRRRRPFVPALVVFRFANGGRLRLSAAAGSAIASRL